ncbi:MAG: hypothetical protein K9W44_12280 [Candidatus Lokiarchaeota archaeon]|nr:hypothetical protein [Candidatus Harpocratesius repetitus]
MEPDISSQIIELLQKFNNKIQGVIEGPNCIDPTICHGDCCFVHLDVPKALVDFYISHGLAKKSDFKRGNMFAFEVNMDLNTLKCPFFSKKINGCKVHFSGVKIPQCWVYPTGLDPNNVEYSCKRVSGWKITKPVDALEGNRILESYILKCKQEAEKEHSVNEVLKRLKNLHFDELLSFAPAHLSGIKDDWDNFKWNISESWNLALKPYCESIPCEYEYFECIHICETLRQKIQDRLTDQVKIYIKQNGYKPNLLFSEFLK